jgi:hypothetical protein
MKIIETTVYTYDELNDKAKEKARDWYRNGGFDDTFWSECTIEDAVQCSEYLGIEINERGEKRKEPCIFWSGFASQGDGACFQGSWSASKVQPGKLAENAPEDKELHRIAAEFERVAKEFPHASFTVKHSGHYYHKGCTDFTVSILDDDSNEIDTPESNQAEKDLIEVARDFMEWIYRQLEQQWDYVNSDEQVAETILANEYEFTEDGKRF